MKDDLESRIDQKLEEYTGRGLSRALRVMPSGLRDFTSNDYLGLARSETLAHRVRQRLDDNITMVNGSGGSRLLSGNSLLAEEAEQFLAAISRAGSSLLFNSGYMANVGVLSTIPGRGDTILYDEYAHASIKDGIRLSLADRYSFRHNNMDDLRRKLANRRGTTYIVVESIYSMDGDECPLRDLVNVAADHNAVIILDEAHATGTYGTGGGGLAVAQGVHERIPIRILTFGKAMGVHGACVCCSTKLRDFLINFSRPFIYTTALPPHSIAAIMCSFEFLGENDHLRHDLEERIGIFQRHYHKETGSNSAIQPVRLKGNKYVRNAAAHLQGLGYDVRPVLSPTVREGMERLRICLHVFNSDDDIVALASELNQFKNV